MKKYFLLLLAVFCASGVFAHGDEDKNDHRDHAHAAPSAVLETNATVPTLSTQSETFELVARLYADELGLYIDDWASNVPVLNATVEVELNGKKAVAKFHADHGDYAVADPEMLKALHAAGEHALMFTISAGKRADLLTGELHVHADTLDALAAKPMQWLLRGLLAVLILLGCALALRHLLRARKGEKA